MADNFLSSTRVLPESYSIHGNDALEPIFVSLKQEEGEERLAKNVDV